MDQQDKKDIFQDANYNCFNFILDELRGKGSTTSERGTLFERFCLKILRTSPFFIDDVKQAWRWDSFPGNGGRHDNGIDIVVLDRIGQFWAIQAKFYDCDSEIKKSDIDSFISASSREFTYEGKTYSFTNRYLFSTTEKVSRNAQELVTLFGPQDLLECGIDWTKFTLDDIEDSMVALPKKRLKEHQKEALNDVLNGFKSNDRGRLIMACGTGKTFTSLKIVERYIEENNILGANANILYLVPSIPLLSQTILEWKSQLSYSEGCDRFGICSDNTAGKTRRNLNADEITVNMPIPSTTDVTRISEQLNRLKKDIHDRGRIHFFFSTYQSIDVIHELQEKCGFEFDRAICDEAHRTIGAYKDEDDKTDFTKIHDNSFIRAKKRLYRTATEKIYSSVAKADAEEEGWSVFSMDDEKVFGPQFHYLSFGKAVSKGLLTDYRLIVLTVNKSNIAALKLSGLSDVNLNRASKIVGSLSALSKLPPKENPEEFAADPDPRKRVVAFCSTIKEADQVAQSYQKLPEKSCFGQEYRETQGYIIPKAKLITGEDNIDKKNRLLKWLRGQIEPKTCHILTNARCLSEGVDVPALDAVLFMAKKKSQVDIIQAVGRVRRKFGAGAEKKYGYIIIPVVIDDDSKTDITLSNSEDYKVVWQVVQALRSHDERLEAQINQIGQSKKLPPSICQINAFVPPRSRKGNVPCSSLRKDHGIEGPDTDSPVEYDIPKLTIPSDEELKKQEGLFSAQLVKHCGNRLYWEDWSKNIGDVTNNIALRIKAQIKSEDKTRSAFEKFRKGLCHLLNPSITEEDSINRLAEHIVTLPVLKSIFASNDLIDDNPVTKMRQKRVRKINGVEAEIESLKPFYDSVQLQTKDLTDAQGRQEVIRKLFDKFFQYALPKSADKFGIVYTPLEIVDFIIHSVENVMENEFHQKLTNPDVKILDPFTGTGTFIAELMRILKECGATNEQLKYKYSHDIWCNEIRLLAYYISLINIEDTYNRLTSNYEPFTHAVLTDTFEMSEHKPGEEYQGHLNEEEDFKEASEIAREEDKQNIRIIIGNPPYSVGQHNANEGNKNNSYPSIDNRISKTYRNFARGANKKLLYDSYVRAFRWASDRISDNGIVSFVSNGSYVDNIVFSGFRKSLLEEFNHVYVYNLRGNQRTMGELSRKEGGKIFGSGSRNTICIIVLVKHQGQPFDGFVHYKDIGDYLTREQKLEIIKNTHDISQINWERIVPDKNNDWINKTNTDFERFIPLAGKKLEIGAKSVFSSCYSSGIKTGKDTWIYNFDSNALRNNVALFINEYNRQKNIIIPALKGLSPQQKIQKANNMVTINPKAIKWNAELISYMSRGGNIDYSDIKFVTALFRPFVKKRMAYCPSLIQGMYKWQNIIQNPLTDSNRQIVVSGAPLKRNFSIIASDGITDLDVFEHCQVFPRLWNNLQKQEISLFDSDSENVPFYAITDEFLEHIRHTTKKTNISKEDAFYYIYALLHSNVYRNEYKANLSKEFPRVPIVENLENYISIGKQLYDLHINYESVKKYPGVNIEIKKNDYSISKIRFLSKERKDTIIFNPYITISNIPREVYEYKLSGRSPIEWVMDQYQYSVDSDSGIIDDPNQYDPIKGGKYIFDLILSLITVSLETQKLIASLPEYKELD